jgi:competence ComEA-like helix-hairpin-helix protein
MGAAGLALAAGAPVSGQEAEEGTLGISPAKREVTARPPVRLEGTRLSNTTDLTFRMRIFPALLEQAEDGSYNISERPGDLRAARNILPVEPRRTTLRPGESIQVQPRWQMLPRRAKAAYVGLVFEGVPSETGSSIGSISRVVQLNFLREPGDARVSGRLLDLRGEQAGERRLRFLVRARNTGEIQSAPRRTAFAIRDARDRIVFSTSWEAGAILPGATRVFPVDVAEVLSAGRYTAVARARFSERGKPQVVRTRFQLTGPNELPTRRLDLVKLEARGEMDETGTAEVVVRNTGTAAAAGRIVVDVGRLDDAGQLGRSLGRGEADVGDLEPGRSTTVEVDLPAVPAGAYRATAVLSMDGEEVERLTADYAPTEPTSWFRGIWPAIAALLGLGLLALLVAWLLRRRRTAAGPAADDGGLVDLNHAGTDELQVLPGVGPKAAQRIVDRREEYGPFNDVEDLAKIEGFDAERIDALRERVSVSRRE